MKQKAKLKERIPHEEIHRAQSMFINYASAWGLIPFYFNWNDQTVYHIKSKWRLLRWYITLLVSQVVKCILITKLGIDFYSGTPDLSAENAIRVFFTGWYFGCGGLHFHTIWKRYEIPSVMNSAHEYYLHYMAKFAKTKDVEEEWDICAVLMKGFFALFILTSFGVILLFATNCEFHFLTPVLDTCLERVGEDGGISLHHRSVWGFLVLCIVQFVMATELTGATFIYFGWIIPEIYVGVDLIKDLLPRTPNSKCKESLHDHDNWFKHYNACAIMVHQVNGVIAAVLTPLQILIIGSIAVVTNYILIRVHVSPSLTILCILLDINIYCYLYIMMRQGSKFEEFSKLALSTRKAACISKFAAKTLKACRKMGANVGPFGILDKMVLVVVFEAIQNYTISAILTA